MLYTVNEKIMEFEVSPHSPNDPFEDLQPGPSDAGDVFAFNVRFQGELGDALWHEVESRHRELFRILNSHFDAEFGDDWETMVSVYRGSTNINIVLHSNGGDEPRQSLLARVMAALYAALSDFVRFARDLWEDFKIHGRYLKRGAASLLNLKTAGDEVAEWLGFGSALEAAKGAVRWLLRLWGINPGPGYA